MGVYIGWPGNVYDACMFVNSNHYQKHSQDNCFHTGNTNCNIVLSSFQVPMVILGDPAITQLCHAHETLPRDRQYHISSEEL